MTPAVATMPRATPSTQKTTASSDSLSASVTALMLKQYDGGGAKVEVMVEVM